MISAEHLRATLDYNPSTGALTWRRRSDAPALWNAKCAGKQAGYLHHRGYVHLEIHGKYYAAHRIVWLWVYGEWPGEIDHINGIKNDNRIINLRICTRSQNCQNTKRREWAAAGIKGVYRNKNRWTSAITISGVRHYLGNFATPEEAGAAYAAAAKRLFGEFARIS
jgi:hypothetical protein